MLISRFAFSQEPIQIEKSLNILNDKRILWSNEPSLASYDSLNKYNTQLQHFIVDFSAKNSQTLSYPFKSNSGGFDIVSSKDGNLRIYTWNEFGGGTMQFYRNVFQYASNQKVNFKYNEIEAQNNGCSYYEINEVVSGGKKYYLTSNISIGSSANFYYQIKVFSIENGKLNENAKLIKTKTGLKNTLGYEVDLSSSSNRERTDCVESRDFIAMKYDKVTNTIIIPLINADGKKCSFATYLGERR